jgi:hypothetical protein
LLCFICAIAKNKQHNKAQTAEAHKSKYYKAFHPSSTSSNSNLYLLNDGMQGKIILGQKSAQERDNDK